MKIWRDFTFEAAHTLPHLPATLHGSKLHGHSYKARVTFEGEPDANGILIDDSILARVLDELFRPLAYSHLNDLIETPTSENIAKHIGETLGVWGAPNSAKLISVEVSRPSVGMGAIWTA